MRKTLLRKERFKTFDGDTNNRNIKKRRDNQTVAGTRYGIGEEFLNTIFEYRNRGGTFD